jgi:hypothetical protein
MEAITNFLGRDMIFWPMVIIFLGLIGVLVFLRMKPKKDEDDE